MAPTGSVGRCMWRVSTHDVKEYPPAGHGFLNDHREGEVPVLFRLLGVAIHDGFHGPSAADARQRIVEFFQRHLDASGESFPAQ